MRLVYKLKDINNMENFLTLNLHEVLTQSLLDMKFQKPTPIQAQTIPHALEGKDVLGSAQTGTGKTVAYGIPLISYLLNKDHGSAIVLAPTRELAMQVINQLHMLLGKKSHIKSTLLIGGDSMFKQLAQLKNRPRLIVGTPGRVNDHLERGTLKLHNAEFLVFDETDRMLDMGFSIQIQQIVKYMPEKRQTLMFSATMSPSIIKTAQNYLQTPVRISVGSTTAPTDKIKQEIIKTTDSEKYNILMDHLEKSEGSFIIFMKTKHATERLALKLRGSGHTADAIHGDLRQRNREQVIRSFRDGKHRILVATDVAARGLDIPHIEYVVNYDLPMNPEDYIHRIGRTGRAGKEGTAISFVTPSDGSKWRVIHKLINDGEHSAPDTNRRSAGGGGRRDGGNGGGFNSGAPRRDGGRNDRNDDRKKDFRGGPRPREGGRPAEAGWKGDFKKKEFGGNSSGCRFEGDSRKKEFGGAPKRFEGDFKKKEFGGNSSGGRFEGDSKKKEFGSAPKRFEGDFKKKEFGGNASGNRFEGDRNRSATSSRPGDRDNRSARPDSGRSDRGPSNYRGNDAKRSSGPRPTRVA